MKPAIDCACVIHGTAYHWDYVERLYSMLTRHLSSPVNMHVFTEGSREVPSHMIKHPLIEWGLGGPKQGWWYKIQLFNINNHRGPLLYFDLDTVITDSIDWIPTLPTEFLWAPRDFKYLWRPNHTGINSSVMWFDTTVFHRIYKDFASQDVKILSRRYPGDQDYLTEQIDFKNRRFLDEQQVKSWRWQCYDGGFDFKRRTNRYPGAGTNIDGASVLVFHGKPKPAEITDPVILEHWC